ncbi:membrane peptidoglycan carboxypeptidase [Actinoplanes lutulentus]|uniref:Membrane peptidoglycan carboxypeptidase n=2 Tax=Actinoplanes lutulentus TaxID=1287878 RepID=A0A327ZEU0_9ACTN|nr:membrane peptidoglycan carboxypeptidase [Actinoplanes lutulentus]
MLGVGIVGGTYFFDDVELPTPEAEAQMNVITDSKGNTLAKDGSPRINVPYQNISEVMQNAVAAAEDKNFYTHNGIDMKGIARAAWNNFTGGDKQGASTITQQYARHVAELKEISYSRKLREAVIARKLESKYDKPQIMGMYLNYIDLGEGRYGAEAAANGYFNASVVKGAKNEINVYQAAVIASIIKQPYPNDYHKGYDPNYNPTDAKDRWEYTLANMLEKGWMTQEQYDKRAYPKVNPISKSATCKTCADGKPVGMVMRHVKFELAQMGITEDEYNQGGYTITTTINPKVQAAAEAAGSRKSKTSPLNGRPKSYQSAVIGIDPDTGRVLGYYAGDDPNGMDYGGYMAGDGSGILDYGGQSPGSTFKIYTLAAGLKEDISFKTTWDGTQKRPNGTKISNAGAEDSAVCQGKIKYCDLEFATVKSYNFPFYWIANNIGRDKVIAAARDAGIRYMWTDAKEGSLSGEMVDLTKTNASKWKSGGYFDNEVAFGQYRVVPLEHAQGVATIVNGGVRHDAHFIKTVKKRDSNTGKQTTVSSDNLKGKQVFDSAQMSNLLGVMSEIPKAADNRISDGRESVAKSGTWEYKKGNGDTWFVGGIPQLAVTVWVGGAKDKVELKEAGGTKKMFGSGTPAAIWEEFIETVVDELKWEKKDFPDRIETGNPDSEYANGQDPPPVVTPTEDPNQSQVCQQFPILCQGQEGNTGNTGNTGDTGNAGNGNGNGNGDTDDGD